MLKNELVKDLFKDCKTKQEMAEICFKNIHKDDVDVLNYIFKEFPGDFQYVVDTIKDKINYKINNIINNNIK